MVSKTYMNWEETTKPYEKNGKLYIKVKKENKTKEVRWYYYDEWAKKYPELADKGYLKHGFFPQKNLFSVNDIVYLIDEVEDNIYCKQHPLIWYNKKLGWYTLHPDDIKKDFIINTIPWSEIGDEEGYLY